MKYRSGWIFIFFLFYSSTYPYISVTENFKNRIRVLYISGNRGAHENYYCLEFLERKTDLRFIYQRNSTIKAIGDDESSQICDGVLWDNAQFPLFLEKRLEQLREYLQRENFDFIVLEGANFSPDIEKEIVDYVKNGGLVIWLSPSIVEEGFLKEICPFVKKEGRRDNSGVIIENTQNPYFCGHLTEEMFENISFSPILFKEGTEVIVRTKKENYGILGIRKYGEGEIIGFSSLSLIPVIHNYGDKNKIDTDFLWAELWQHVGIWKKWKEEKNPIQIEIIPEDKEISAGERVNFKIKFYKRGIGNDKVSLKFFILDNLGKEFCENEIKLSNLKDMEISLQIPDFLHSGKYLLVAKIGSKKFNYSSYASLRINGLVNSSINTEKFGYKIGEKVEFKAEIKSLDKRKVITEFIISTPFREIANYQEKEVNLQKGDNLVTFFWEMPDYGIEGWAFCATLLIKDKNGNIIDYSQKWFWKYEPWTMREKFLISNYWAYQDIIPSSLFPLFVLYHKGIGYNAGHGWREPYYSRFNMHAWYQFSATMMENYTNNFTTEDFSHLKKMAKDLFEKSLHTSAYVIYDFGEETGFYYHWSNNPFGREWKDDKNIPLGAHRFFQMYLKEKYGDIEKLNKEWETSYKSFDEIKLSSNYGYPSGWLFLPPPENLPENIGKYIDTHGFFFWYTKKVAQTITDEIREYNPTPNWGMSFSLTFNLFSPIPMTMIHPCYNSQILVPWNNKAVRFSKNGSTPLFSFHWGFSPDYRIWAQFWNQSLAALSTFISNWGSQFNPDLTHSRSTFALKKLMRNVRKKEKFFMDCYPVENFDIGFYHPDLDWQQVHSHPAFFLKAQGPKSEIMGQLGYKPTGTGWLGGPHYQIFNALNSSGYVVRYVDENEIEKCRVLVIPYVECMSISAAEKIKRFVENGGLLITFPIIAEFNEYGRPYKEYPGAGFSELIGMKMSPEIIGKRSIITLHSLKEFPLKFTPRNGSEPPYLWTFGHQKVLSKDEDVNVLFTHYDGNPAITLKKYGKGKVIHFNMFTFDHFYHYEFSHFQNETLRQMLDNIVKMAGIEPFFQVERPLFYGEGINEWVYYQYQLKGSPVRVLAIYSDKTNPEITGEIVLRDKMNVYDILNDFEIKVQERKLPKTVEEEDPFAFIKSEKKAISSGYSFPVKMGPGDVKFFAFSPYRIKKVDVTLMRKNIKAGDPIELTLKLFDDKGEILEYPHPVQIEVYDKDGTPLPILKRKIDLKGERKFLIPTLIGQKGGMWKILVRDCISGKESKVYIYVNDNPFLLSKTGEIPDILYSSSKLENIKISDSEFLSLLKSLKELYLSAKFMDRATLSYYTFEKDISRHRIMKLLNQVNWLEKVNLLKEYIYEGNTVILTGEDMGIDFLTGMSINPISEKSYDESVDSSCGGKIDFMGDSNILPALEKLTGIKNLKEKLEKEGRIIFKIGKGTLFLDSISFDNICSMNGEFEIEYRKWVENVERKGIK